MGANDDANLRASCRLPRDLWRVSYRARLTLFAMVYALANGVPAAGRCFRRRDVAGRRPDALRRCVADNLRTRMARAQLDPAWRNPSSSVPSPGRCHGRRPVADRSRAVRFGDLTAKDMSVVSAPTLKTLYFEDKEMLDRQERHGGEGAVVFPPFRPHGGWHLPQRGVASPDGRQDEILISSSCRRAPKALPIVVPTRVGSRFC